MKAFGAVRTRRITAAILFALCAASASAQSGYPSRPIRMVVDTSPGGLTDILGRVAAEGLARELGRQVVVENKAGASGNVAIEYVVKSPADGHTLMICAGGNLVIKPFLEHSLVFDPLVDLVPVLNFAEAPHILVVPSSLAVKDIAEFVAYARGSPGKVYYGSAGGGRPPPPPPRPFARPPGVPLAHLPHQGGGPALPPLIPGPPHILSLEYASARAV